MSRLDYLTIGIVALCIAALIYLVYRYVNLPHGTENNQPRTEVLEPDTTQSSTNDTTGFPAEDTTLEHQPGPGAEINPEKTPAKPEITKPVPEPIKPIEPTTSNESVAVAAGRYMVIAGSFEQLSHAQKQLKKVQKLGYSQARIEKFNRGTYASVLVDRFDQASQAKALVKTLKGKGFDAMVLEKR